MIPQGCATVLPPAPSRQRGRAGEGTQIETRPLPIIHVSPLGHLGNRIIQYMAARAIAAQVGEVRYSAIGLPHFGIAHPPVEGDFPATEIVTSPVVEVGRLARALASGALQRVNLRTYGQRLENFLPPEDYRAELTPRGPRWGSTGPDELLINIRQGDMLDGRHGDYVLVPVAFYADLVAETGLAPVFMGQLEDSPYMRALRRAFPRARYWPSRGALVDYERIRRARHIVPSISTFAWVAAWLSEAQCIYQPVLGLLHPMQNRAVNLLPLTDPRYRFYYFPLHYGVPVQQAAAAHASNRRPVAHMPAPRLAALLARQPPPRNKPLYLEAFDEAFYRAVYPDIAREIGAGNLPSGRHHYDQCGFNEGRAGFALDRGWYCRTYRIAALEIAEGQFTDADQHWLELGRARAYRRGPAEAT